MAAPHAIHEEFPHDAETIHALKIGDHHFARLLTEYDAANDAVEAAASNVHPTDGLHEGELRRKRAALKDEIARRISAAKASA